VLIEGRGPLSREQLAVTYLHVIGDYVAGLAVLPLKVFYLLDAHHMTSVGETLPQCEEFVKAMGKRLGFLRDVLRRSTPFSSPGR